MLVSVGVTSDDCLCFVFLLGAYRRAYFLNGRIIYESSCRAAAFVVDYNICRRDLCTSSRHCLGRAAVMHATWLYSVVACCLRGGQCDAVGISFTDIQYVPGKCYVVVATSGSSSFSSHGGRTGIPDVRFGNVNVPCVYAHLFETAIETFCNRCHSCSWCIPVILFPVL